LAFGILWFIVTLSPVLYFANHYYAYYVPIPLFGLLLAAFVSFEKGIYRKYPRSIMFVGIFLLFWIFGSWKTLRLNEHIHWVTRRAQLSQKLTTELVEKYSTLPEQATVVFTEAVGSDEYKWAMGDQYAVKTLYGLDSLRTVFGKDVNNNGSVNYFPVP